MRHLALSYVKTFHPSTFGGKAAFVAKDYIKQGNLFMALTILRGLGLDVKLITVKAVLFTETTQNKRGLNSPVLIISCEKYKKNDYE